MAPLVRMTVFIKKLDSITDEEFHKHWSTNHAKIALSLKAVQDKIVRYSQFHADPVSRSKLTAFGMPMIHYDGGVDLWAKSEQDLIESFTSDEFVNILAPDEENFIDKSQTKMMIGYDLDFPMDGSTLS